MDVKISSVYITLGQFIKYVGIITNGAEAKMFLASNEAYVNNELDTRRRRKLYPGDVVKIKNQEYRIIS